jgi:hypothetical protein
MAAGARIRKNNRQVKGNKKIKRVFQEKAKDIERQP